MWFSSTQCHYCAHLYPTSLMHWSASAIAIRILDIWLLSPLKFIFMVLFFLFLFGHVIFYIFQSSLYHQYGWSIQLKPFGFVCHLLVKISNILGLFHSPNFNSSFFICLDNGFEIHNSFQGLFFFSNFTKCHVCFRPSASLFNTSVLHIKRHFSPFFCLEILNIRLWITFYHICLLWCMFSFVISACHL